MSLADATAADEALAPVAARRLTRGQRAQQQRERQALADARTLERMTTSVANLVTMSNSVTRRDLVEQGFSEAEIDTHFRRAVELAGVAAMVS